MYVRSPIAFYQMVGRGTCLDPPTNKLMFTVWYDVLGELGYGMSGVRGAGGLAALRAIGNSADVLRETKERMFAT